MKVFVIGTMVMLFSISSLYGWGSSKNENVKVLSIKDFDISKDKVAVLCVEGFKFVIFSHHYSEDTHTSHQLKGKDGLPVECK